MSDCSRVAVCRQRVVFYQLENLDEDDDIAKPPGFKWFETDWPYASTSHVFILEANLFEVKSGVLRAE